MFNRIHEKKKKKRFCKRGSYDAVRLYKRSYAKKKNKQTNKHTNQPTNKHVFKRLRVCISVQREIVQAATENIPPLPSSAL